MALTAMRQHWQFWQEEYKAARENGDAKRVEECKRYIRRCVIVDLPRFLGPTGT